MAYRDKNGARGADSEGLGGFGAIVDRVLSQNRLAESLRPHQALALWAEVAGERVASVAQAESVRGRVLFVRTKSSVWANELTFFKADLLTRLNARLGGEFIDDIHFQTGNRPEQARGSRVGQAATDEPSEPILETPMQASLPDAGRLEVLVARTQSTLAWKRAHGWVECSRCSALFVPPETKTTAAPVRRPRQRRPFAICPICVTLVGR